MDYTLALKTIPGIADSAYLDRLAELVYELDGLVDPLLALGPDGSIEASFCVQGPDPLRAAQGAIESFVRAAADAGPLVEGSQPLGSLAVSPVGARESAVA
jgi:hypothetical protein